MLLPKNVMNEQVIVKPMEQNYLEEQYLLLEVHSLLKKKHHRNTSLAIPYGAPT